MRFEDYKVILYRQDDNSCAAEIPSIPSCYALNDTREQALTELGQVFKMIEDSHRERRVPLLADTTEIVNA